jgi:hypothetical protein
MRLASRKRGENISNEIIHINKKKRAGIEKRKFFAEFNLDLYIEEKGGVLDVAFGK